MEMMFFFQGFARVEYAAFVYEFAARESFHGGGCHEADDLLQPVWDRRIGGTCKLLRVIVEGSKSGGGGGVFLADLAFGHGEGRFCKFVRM
jgi:hypothetical protein